MLPTYTTNITGFFTCWRGVSLRSESARALFRMVASKSGWRRGFVAISFVPGRLLLADYDEVVPHRCEGERREERERAHRDHGADQQHDEKRRMGGKRAGARGHGLFRRERAGDRQHGYREPVARD